MAVGDNISYIKVLTTSGTGLKRILLVPPEDNSVLGNVNDGIDDLDVVNVRQLRKVISELPTGGLQIQEGDGILVDNTDPENPIISLDIDYVIDNLPEATGFMHLTGAVDESADGNKTFTGHTTVENTTQTRVYSAATVSPNITFFNNLENGKTMLSLSGTVGSGTVNYLEIVSSLSTNSPSILAKADSDTNVGINLTPKGSGTVNITNLTGAVTEMVTITASGQLGRQAIPSGGGGTDVTIGTFGTTPDAQGATINGAGQILTIQPSDATHPGAISLVAQTLGAGDKTFTDHVVMGVNKEIRNAAGTQFLRIDAGGFINLQGSANTVIRGGGTTSQLTLSSSAAIIGAPAITLSSTSMTTITAATGQTISFGTTGTTGETTGDINFTNLRPVYLKSVGALAPAAASQKGSSILNFESNLFNGTTGVLKVFSVSAVASTSTNNLTDLITKYDGTNLTQLSQTGDFEILNTGAGIILKDSVAGTRHRVTLASGVLTVSAAL